MALTDPKNTLAFHQSRVLSQHVDNSHVPCKQVVKAMKAYKSSCGADAVPETEALWFYGMNHGVAAISAKRAPLEPLDKWELSFVDTYYSLMSDKATRAFHYLIRICIREARHNKSFSKSIPEVKKLYGEATGAFFENLKGGEDAIMNAFNSQTPDVSIGQLIGAVGWMFYNSSWNGGYGGKAWGAVNDCLENYIKGVFTAEMMLDTIWTLSHNNGPIFNKNWLYLTYSPANIVRLLDIQRSGQIPTAILHDNALSQYAPVDMIAWMAGLRDRFPDAVRDYVDWEVVEALGSVHKYPLDKMEQAKAHGLSPAAQAAYDAAQAKKKAAEAKAQKEAEEFAKHNFVVMPGVFVKKIEIKRAA